MYVWIWFWDFLFFPFLFLNVSQMLKSGFMGKLYCVILEFHQMHIASDHTCITWEKLLERSNIFTQNSVSLKYIYMYIHTQPEFEFYPFQSCVYSLWYREHIQSKLIRCIVSFFLSKHLAMQYHITIWYC